METYVVLAILGLMVFLIPLLLLVFFYNTAKNKTWASFPASNTIEFVNAGEGLIRVLPNVEGRVLTWDKVNEEYRLEKKGEAKNPVVWVNPLARLLRSQWGFYWVSWFYPLRRIHEFKIIKERLKGSAEIGNSGSLRDRIERDSHPVTIDHLLAHFIRPFVIEGVEPKDNFKLDILVIGMFDVVVPSIIAYKLQERYFDTLKAAISGAVMDWVRKGTYTQFVDSDKGKDSKFSTEITNSLKAHLADDLGVEIAAIWVEDYRLVEGVEVQKAVQAMELAVKTGEAKVREAELGLKAAELNAKGAAAPVRELVIAYGEARKSNVAELVNAERVSDNLGNGSVTTLVMGGHSLMPVNLGINPATPPTSTPPTK